MYRNTAPAQGCGCLVFDCHNVDIAEAAQRTELQAVCAATPVIVIADCGDVPTAVCGMKSGAVDIVQKPYRENRLVDSINRAIASAIP
jgi:FixJ family two-component response regulator